MQLDAEDGNDEDEDDDEDEDHDKVRGNDTAVAPADIADNATSNCRLVWQGTLPKRIFSGFKSP